MKDGLDKNSFSGRLMRLLKDSHQDLHGEKGKNQRIKWGIDPGEKKIDAGDAGRPEKLTIFF